MAYTKQEYHEIGTNTSTGGFGETCFGGQTFRPVTAHTITRVGFYGGKDGSPSGLGYIDLYNCNQTTHLPIGNRLARASYETSDCNPEDEGGIDPAWVESNLDSAIALDQDTEYALILYQPNSESSGDSVKFKSESKTPTYTRGVLLFSNTGFANLAVYSTYDYQFREYSGSVGVSIVTTQACTGTTAQKSIGHGTYQGAGSSAVSQHGHVWDTSTDPTTSLDTKTENGAAPNLGQFQSDMPNLIPGTTYYVRAYVVNTSGTSYGGNVNITTGTTIGRRHWWTDGGEFHWWAGGVHYKVVGIEDTSGLPWWWYM